MNPKIFFKLLKYSLELVTTGRLNNFGPGKKIFIQLKVFGRKVKETVLTRYFTKLTACHGFT